MGDRFVARKAILKCKQRLMECTQQIRDHVLITLNNHVLIFFTKGIHETVTMFGNSLLLRGNLQIFLALNHVYGALSIAITKRLIQLDRQRFLLIEKLTSRIW